MAFRFIKEDFERYVKMDEHGGRHIWHELQERLEGEFSVPFAQAPFIARGDRLRTIWFSPKAGPRSKWDNQAQFFLARNIEEKRLFFGLMIECPPSSDVTKSGYDPDRDGLRLIAQLERNPGFVDQLDRLANQTGWEIVVNEWSEQWHTIRSGAQLLDVLGGMPDGQGWGVHVQRVLTAERAVDAGAAIADRIMEAYRTVRPLWEALIPEAVRIFLETGETTGSPKPSVQKVPSLTSYFSSQGFWFSPLTLATYFTALQTKGFVILSGLSGTGKTKLAQHFAELLAGEDSYHFVVVRPDWRDSKSLLGCYNPLSKRYEFTEFLRFVLDATDEFGSATEISRDEWLKQRLVEWSAKRRAREDEFHRQVTRQSLDKLSDDEVLSIWDNRNPLASAGRAPLLRVPVDTLREVTRILADDTSTPGVCYAAAMQFWQEQGVKPRPWARTLRALATFVPIIPAVLVHSRLRRLLRHFGYESNFNRLHPEAFDRVFQFLHDQIAPILQAIGEDPTDPVVYSRAAWRLTDYLLGIDVEVESREAVEVSPYFAVLDEMNLARIEYYFADFLSVLESGRRNDGYTKEVLRLQYPPECEGERPPRELRLPPNLYFVGTVNVDETTHAFSPKVLDRAFTIEITDVDLERYPAEIDGEMDREESVALTERLLPIFTRDGRFGIVEKSEIRDFVAAHPEYRAHLDRLKNLLQPYDLHFAYRVFDEIISFCANARANGLWADLGGLEPAFDCAVLMKVLPKFHGPRGKLDRPLRDVLAWTLNPDSPGHATDQVKELTKDADTCLKLRQQLDAYVSGQDSTAFRYPHTARKVVRMLQALHASGFASFA